MKKSLWITIILMIIIIVSDIIIVMNDPKIIGGIINPLENQNLREEKIVTKIIDGDTVIVEGGENVRLLGIDCDEKGKKCFTPAKNRIEELLLGKKVILEQEGENKDMYKRDLRYIFLDGKNINVQMVEEGFCVARFQEESKHKEEVQKAESFAIENKIGCKWNN